ncbi:MAG: hypothetical protein GX998_01870 [Firmicutes bacterium]|nr:hypothetical protein [Bacillota bacterium]
MGLGMLLLQVALISGVVALCGLAVYLCGCSYWPQRRPKCRGNPYLDLLVEAEPATESSNQLPWPAILLTIVRLALWVFQGSVVLLVAIQAVHVFC